MKELNQKATQKDNGSNLVNGLFARANGPFLKIGKQWSKSKSKPLRQREKPGFAFKGPCTFHENSSTTIKDTLKSCHKFSL